MSSRKEVSLLRLEMQEELDHLLRWWSTHMVDQVNGGFYGRMDHDGNLYPKANKSIIMHSRILWTFAAAANLTGQKSYQLRADHAYNFILSHFVDQEYGGVHWMLDDEGRVVNDRKQIYAQAFTIYALAAYYRLTDQTAVLDLALHLFALIEKHSFDVLHGGYFEAFDRQWKPMADVRLSEKDANEVKTMNTHLHLLEAYTTLYRGSEDKEVKAALLRLIHCFLDRFVDPKTGHLCLFFDEVWEAKSSVISYGHDIEASWLLTTAVDLLALPTVQKTAKAMALHLAKSCLLEGMDPQGGINNEQKEDGTIDTDKHWWPQAEAVVGFWNAWELSGEVQYQENAWQIWTFIRQEIKDQRRGEWLWGRKRDGTMMSSEDKAGPWKAPYHNGRMCMEMIRRLSHVCNV